MTDLIGKHFLWTIVILHGRMCSVCVGRGGQTDRQTDTNIGSMLGEGVLSDPIGNFFITGAQAPLCKPDEICLCDAEMPTIRVEDNITFKVSL